MRVSAIHDSLTPGYVENCPSPAVWFTRGHVARVPALAVWRGLCGRADLFPVAAAAHHVAHFNYTAHRCCESHSQFIAFKLNFGGILDFRMDGGSATADSNDQGAGGGLDDYLLAPTSSGQLVTPHNTTSC